jgi:hypothetical protein
MVYTSNDINLVCHFTFYLSRHRFLSRFSLSFTTLMADEAEHVTTNIEETKEEEAEALDDEGKDSEVKEGQTPDQLLAEAKAAEADGDLENASDLISSALKLQVQKYGELAFECVDYYIAYGEILKEIEQNNQDILGGSSEVPIVSTKTTESASTTASTTSKDTEGKDEESKSEDQSAEPKTEQPGDLGNGDGDGVKESEASDLELAWDHLECARVILQKKIEEIEGGFSGSSTSSEPSGGLDIFELRKRLYGVLISLGDIHVTQENYPEAQVQFLDALKLIEAHDSENWREKSSVCYYLGLSLKSQDAIEAAKYFTQSKECLENYYKHSALKPDQEFLSSIEEKVCGKLAFFPINLFIAVF